MQMKKFDEAAAYFPDLCFKTPPELTILLGSGWSDALEIDEVVFRAAYADIPGFGGATVKGHAGEFILYRRHGKLVAAWCGRHHYYEGLGWEPVVFPIELARRMGGETVLLTNASGGINPALRPGDLLIIRDHINLVGANPLIGTHNPVWGERFPDMTEVYSKHLAELLHAAGNRFELRVMDGVYAYTSGPCYETPAEIQAYKAQGADVVGMSTVPEAVFAKACGMKIAGLSLVTNLAAGISRRPLGHAEVIEASAKAKGAMKSVIGDFLDRI